MCGIVGVWDRTGYTPDSGLVCAMRDRMACRGPDDAGLWVDGAVALAHRRLAVIDPSPAGHQPMVDERTGSALTYNGEVYNFRDLAHELKQAGVTLHTRTDTEVVLKSYRLWGPDCLTRFNGMFALGLWDARRRGLFLARDRIGIKPLYVMIGPRVVLFASRLGPLLLHPDCPREIDREAMAIYLELGYTPSPRTILRGVRKLRPGQAMWIGPDGVRGWTYWNPDQIAVDRSWDRAKPDTATDRLGELIRDAVRLREIADVPLGAFLSGGIDSSLVVAMMMAEHGRTRSAATFTIGFEEADYDEAAHARRIAAHLGTTHHEQHCRADGLLDLLDQYEEHYDEPFADASALPTLQLARFAREHVTVALSGDGGDELFLGYPQYAWLNRLAPAFWIPGRCRRPIARVLAGISRHRPAMLGRFLERTDPVEAFAYAKGILKHDRVDGLCGAVSPAAADLFADRVRTMPAGDWMERAARLDLAFSLPDDLLRKVDAATMAVGLEARVPLLDHRIVEFALSLPRRFKYGRGGGKRLLRRVLARHLPAAWLDRPKQGFCVPLRHWFRRGPDDPCTTMVREAIGSKVLADWGPFDRVRIERLLRMHRAGRVDNAPILWALVCLVRWKRRFDGIRPWQSTRPITADVRAGR